MSECMRLPSGNVQDRARREIQERKRNLLYLITSYLRNINLHKAADNLVEEAQLSQNFELCENIDLDIIYQEYESYYFVKFQKTPKITRKISEDKIERDGKLKKARKQFNKKKESSDSVKDKVSEESDNFQFEIINLSETNKEQPQRYCDGTTSLKPLCEYGGYSTEWRDTAEHIMKEIIPTNLGITWEDCIGLDTAKESLKEAVVYPTLYPNLFTGTLTPWKGILLYGPPGTGKTLLAKALACQNLGPFINVTSSTFISKWRGESEKMIKVLFDLAKFHAPTTIFIDELDALSSSNTDYQHEASARLKSELLINLDGILHGNEKVFVLATTNAPWRLDGALLRRFEKRILIDIPEEVTRIEIFKHYFQKNGYKFLTSELKRMSQMTPAYSCSDIKLVCKEAMMKIVREKLKNPFNKKEQPRQITMEDVAEAVEKIKPCVNSEILKRYRDWNNKYGYT